MQAKDLLIQRPFHDLLIFGDTGSGKTDWASRSPRPLILLTEPHGLQTIASTSPDAEVDLIVKFSDLTRAMKLLKAGKVIEVDGQPALRLADKRVVQTVVLDSLTDLQEIVKRWVVLGEDASTGKSITKITMAQWGHIGDIMRLLLRDLRGLPVNNVALALSDESMDDDQVRTRKPSIFGKVGTVIGQWFSGVGYARKRKGDKGGTQYVISFELASETVTKRPPGFPAHILNTKIPGQTTLGSLALHAWNGEDDTRVPKRETDSADWCITTKENDNE